MEIRYGKMLEMQLQNIGRIRVTEHKLLKYL